MLIVFGSLNMDMVFHVDRFPMPGETLLAKAYDMGAGGKGANQALAAARSGARVALVGMRGGDQNGKSMTIALRRDGVITTGVGESEKSTGHAMIMVDRNGANRIIVAPGANEDTRADQVPDEILLPSNFLLMQMEVPIRECAILLQRAKSHGVTTMLNLAPVLNITQEMLDHLDYLIVNQIEARQLAAVLKLDPEESPDKLASAFSQKGKLTCIVTMGKQGAYAHTSEDHNIHVPALHIEKEVDHTGAGDAYCGTLAACLHGGMKLEEAMRRAAVAGSLTCTKFGAQASMPYLAEIQEHLPMLGGTENSD